MSYAQADDTSNLKSPPGKDVPWLIVHANNRKSVVLAPTWFAAREIGMRHFSCEAHELTADPAPSPLLPYIIEEKKINALRVPCKLCIKERDTETKRRYEREKRDRSKKAASNKRGLELKKFRAATEATDKLYPSHFVRNS
jgi:hypothetical protein